MSRAAPRIATCGRGTRPLIAWLTLLAIAGTLCACGRYGPPKRRSPATTGAAAAKIGIEAPRTSVPFA